MSKYLLSYLMVKVYACFTAVLALCALLLTALPALAQAPTNGLVAYYPFTGNANDATTNANHGIVNGATLTTDRFGNPNSAYSFDGSSHYISVPATSVNRIDTANFSISIWFRSNSTTFMALYTKTENNGPLYTGMNAYLNSDGVSARTDFNNAAVASGSYNNGQWHQMTFVRIGTVHELYVDGVLRATQTSSSTIDVGQNTPLIIGRNTNELYHFNGQLDDVKLYNQALSETDVQQLYEAESASGLTLTASNPLTCTATSATLTTTGAAAGAVYAYTGPSGTLPGSTSAIVVSQPGVYSVMATAGGSSLTASTTVVSVTGNGSGTAPATGLVAYYPFTGNANDAAGTLHGTVSGATLTTDRFGNANQAYTFNDSSSIDFAGSPTTVTDNWTVSVWAKVASLNQFGTLVNVGFDNGGNGDGYGLLIANGGGGFGNQVTVIHGGITFRPIPHTVNSTDQWNHFTFLRRNGVSEFYVNGVKIHTENIGQPRTPTDFSIGSSNGIRFFNGSLDEVRIYNQALSETDVQQLYQAELSPSITLSAKNPLTCAATSTTLITTGATAGSVYAYTGPSGTLPGSSSAIVVSQAGVYSVVATGANGCVVSAITTVTSNTTLPTLSVSPLSSTLTGANPSLTLTATSSVTALRWNTGATTASISVSVAGTYSVTATGINGCTASASTTVSQGGPADQTITFAAIPDKYVDETVVLNATATSNLPVSYTLTTSPLSGVASLTGNTITFLGTPGQLTVRAYQGGNQSFKPAELLQTFRVFKRNQTIVFTPIPTKTIGDAPFSLTATATSALPVTFSVVSGSATVSGNSLTLNAPGTVVVEARQPGNNVYSPADVVQQSFFVYEKRPDLAVKQVSSNRTLVGPIDAIIVSWTIANEGIAASQVDWSERIYMQSPSGENRTLIKQLTLSTSNSLAIGQSSSRSDVLTIPAQLLTGDNAVFVIEVIPGASVLETPGQQANNIGIQQSAWAIQKTLSLVLSTSEITEGVTNGITATVSRTGSLTNPAPVTISIGNPARFSIPASIIIPAGQSGTTFALSVPDNNTIENRLTDQLQVSATGYPVAQAAVVVLDNDLPELSITNMPTSSTEGQGVTFKVGTNLAPSSALTVYLQSDSPTRFAVPASVTIAAGVLSVNVSVSLAQNTVPELDQTVIVTAGATNHKPASSTIRVNDDDVPNLELVLQTNSITESAGSFATQATLRRTASANSVAFTANLTASLPNTLLLPGSISLAANENEKTFAVGVVDNTLVDGQRRVAISAAVFVSSCGCNTPPTSSGSVSATLTVNDNDGPSLQATVAQQTLPESLTNAGTLRITRNTPTTNALSITLSSADLTEATVPATAIIPVGQTFVDVPITTLDDNVTDGNQQVYFTATATGFAPGSTWIIVTDLNKPDLQIPLVQLSSATMQAGSILNYRVSVKNTGSATAPGRTLVHGYLSTDDFIDGSDILFAQDTLVEAVPAGQTKLLLNAAKAPEAAGTYKVLFWVNPNASLTELLSTNNTSQPVSITVEPTYTATAVVAPAYFLQGSTVSITGTATKKNGSPAANVAVEVYIITQGIRRKISATTDAAGNYTALFTPLNAESGHYIVGASLPGLKQTTEQDRFDILGVRINGGTIPQFKVTLNEPLTGALTIENLSETNLSNFTLAPIALPGGASIQFATLSSIAGNASGPLQYTVIGSQLSSGNSFALVNAQAKSAEGIIQKEYVYYYCQAANGYLVADKAAIQASVSQSSGERQVEIRLTNRGKGATGVITVSPPKANWITSVTSKTIASLAPGDTAVAVLKFLALAEVPFNFPITGNIGISGLNANGFTIPFTFEKVAEASGTASITVTNQFTYFTDGSPKVKDALVKIANYFTGVVYAQGNTNANGVFTATNVPEGKYRITVEKDKHLPYGNTLEINPGRTTESTVFLEYQAVTFSWKVEPTAVQDQYNVVLETKFETNIPIPVVTIEMPNLMPALSAGQEYPFFITLTNQGLITAEQVTLQLPQSDPDYEFVTNYTPADLLAKQSIQVPVVMRRRVGAAGGRLAATAASGPCVDYVREIHFYKCNLSTGLWQENAYSFKYSGRNCERVPPELPWDTGGKKPLGVVLLCDTCNGEGIATEGSSRPIPAVTGEKKNCVECIADIVKEVVGCLGVGGKIAGPLIVGPLICFSGKILNESDHDKGKGIDCAVDAAKDLAKDVAGDDISGVIPGFGQLYCLGEIIGAVSKCEGVGPGSAGGRIRAGALPNAAFREIATNLQAALNGYNAQRSWMESYFGDMIDKEGWRVLFPLVNGYLSELTPIPASVQTTIISKMAGYDISSSALTAFFTRWNTSIEALNNNIFAPTTAYPTIINWNQVNVYVRALITAHNQSVNKGFKTIGGMYEGSIKSLNEIIEGQKNDVCASVSVQFSQQLTMTREAFEGTLVVSNGHPTDAMTLLRVDLTITDQNGNPANGLFEIQTKSLTNLSDVTGTGQIGGQQQGTAKFLFIPTVAAAPQTAKLYKFGGSITYQDPYANALVTLPLVDVPITVNPSPNLMLHYFMERNILGDDALTSPAIEPSVPAELAVMVENQGYGPAVNMTISSAQPKIIDNEKGLAIDFKLIGSNFQGQPRQLGVTNINFGTIPARQTRIGQWYFTSSLLGKFVSYDAKVVHANSFGNPNLSLIQGVKLHELTKSIRLYGSLEDGIHDFLVNDVFDVADQPDIIYFSQGNRTAKVNAATSGSFNQPVSAPTFANTLTVMPSDTGFNYIKLNDPGNKLYTLVSVTRSDGQVIPLDNAWLTYVTLPVARSPIYENKFHLVDRFTARTATTYSVVWKPVNLNVPKVDSIVGAPAQVAATQVQRLTVYFNKRIDPATFTYEDVGLTLQGGANLINSSVIITQLDTASFSVDLSPVTTGNGLYTFTVQAANVKDIYGISGTTGKQVSWSQFLGVPIVQAFQGIPASRVASAYSTIQLLFNLPIDVATVIPARFTIYKNGVQQPGSLTITAVSQDRKLFSLAGLQTILTQNGPYELRIDLPNIKSENQIAGIQPQSVTLTVDNIGPLVVLLEKSTEGGLDSQHVPFVAIAFNEGVVGLNTAAFQLSRNGQVLPLTSTQLSSVNARSWLAGNFGTLTYPEGNYTFTVNLGNVVDSVGNAGVSTQQVSWTVSRTSSVTVSNLVVNPDLGFSATDGITAAQSLTVNYTLTGNAAKVTISQVDPSGEGILSEQTTVSSGNKTTVVTIASGGTVRIKVTATGANGGMSIAEKALYLDQVPLSAQWQFDPNQTLTTQANAIPLAFSARILNSSGLLNAIQLRRNGVVLPSSGLSIETVNDSLYRIKGINTVSALAGDYQLTANLQSLSKYRSGRMNAGTASVAWTVLSANKAPLTNAGTSITVTSPGIVRLSGAASTDPDGDAITFSWVAPDGVVLSNPTSATTSFTLTEADRGKTYSFLLITSDGSLFSTAVVFVKFDNSISFTQLSSTYCSNAVSQTLTGVPSGGTFSGAGITGNVFTPSVAGTGTHTITYTKDGQPVSQTTTVYALPNLAISPTSASLTCANPTVSLTAVSTGASYTWRGPISYSATTASISVSAAGTYSVTATGTNSCTATVSTTINSNTTAPTLSLTPVSGTLTCAVQLLTLTATSSATALRWNTGATTPSISVSAAGMYSVTATGATGCTATATTTVSSNTTVPSLSLAVSGTQTCAVTSLTLTATSSATALRWSTGATTASISVNTAGTYSVTATGTNGCTATVSTNVSSNTTAPTLSLNPSSGTLTCAVQSLTLTATSSATALRWNTGATTASISVSATGPYSVTAMGTNGCTTSATTTISINTVTPTLSLTPSNGTLTCAVTSLTLTATSSATALRWSTGATTASISVSVAETYSVTATATNGCTATASTTVSSNTVTPNVSVAANGTLTCAQTSVTLSATVTGQAPLIYTFQNASGLLSGSPGSSSTATANTSDSYTVVVTGANGCTARATTTVVQNTTPPSVSISPGSGTLTCATTALTLTASSSATALRWNTGATTTSISVSAAGTYSVTATGTNGCTATASSTVSSLTSLTGFAILGGSTTVCAGSTVSLTATGCTGGSVNWPGGITGATFSTTVAGVYTATCTVGICTTTASSTVIINGTTVSPARLYVRATSTGTNTGLDWANAFTDLQSALNYGCVGNLTEIWVAAGIYKPTSTTARTISFSMKNGVAIYGGFVGTETSLSQRPLVNLATPGNGQPSSSTLSGEIGNPASTTDNSYHVISNPPGLTTTAVLDGFVITGGNADGGSGQTTGGGMRNNGLSTGCSPTIRNCLFIKNFARSGGGLANDSKGTPQISNCAFLNNTSQFDGGGMANAGDCIPIVTNCLFQNNSARNGGGIDWEWSVGTAPVSVTFALTNCSFQSNTATFGGAIYMLKNAGNVTAQLTNCSFQSNTATKGSAVGTFSNSDTGFSTTLTNGVVWNNSGDFDFYNGYSTVSGNSADLITARYSLFDNTVTGYTGPNNLTVTTSPYATTTGTQLATGSPAIDSGDPTTSTATVGLTDLAGNLRFVSGRIDRGAYEFQIFLDVYTLKNGNWNDPTVWSVGRLPLPGETVRYRHVVTVPAGITAVGRISRFEVGGRLIFQAGAKLQISQ